MFSNEIIKDESFFDPEIFLLWNVKMQQKIQELSCF